jgi:hypothetical protein
VVASRRVALVEVADRKIGARNRIASTSVARVGLWRRTPNRST